MPRPAKSQSADSTANLGFEKCEVRSASVEVKTVPPFGIRNSSFAVSRADIGKEHADTFRHVQHPDLRESNAANSQFWKLN